MTNAIVLDDIPRPIWIVLTILGFIFFWPIGLAMVAYSLWSGKMRCGPGNSTDWRNKWRSRAGLYGSTGNHAFDDYRDQTLRKLEEDAREFRGFVDRLRQAKDKEEFDRFMSERNFKPVTPAGGTQ
jgi:hypothetical protein